MLQDPGKEAESPQAGEQGLELETRSPVVAVGLARERALCLTEPQFPHF